MKNRKKEFFKFCPVCAGNLTIRKRHGFKRLICSKCSFVFFQNSKPTVTAFIINKERQILLTRRAIRPKFGYWDAPGGFLEDGEKPIKGLKREMKEEMGISLKNISYLGIYIDTYYVGYKIYTLNIAYQVEIKNGKLKPMDDVCEIKWFDKKNIPWNKIGFVWIKKALKDYFIKK